MSTIMIMHWSEATREQYEAVRAIVKWDTDHPDGAKLHVCGFADDGMHILDVWESEAAFGAFMDTRLGRGIQQVGIEGEPNVTFLPLHAVFAPALGQPNQVPDI